MKKKNINKEELVEKVEKTQAEELHEEDLDEVAGGFEVKTSNIANQLEEDIDIVCYTGC